MEISFQTKELRDICQTQAIAETSLGIEVASVIRRRVADLIAANSYLELPLGNPRFEYIDNSECLILDLKLGYFFQFVPSHIVTPRCSDGTVEWSRVFRVKLMKIGKNNDSC